MAEIGAKILVTDFKGRSVYLNSCISFVFQREIYTPYTQVSGVFICDKEIKAADVKGINFFMGDLNVFFGIPDKVEIRFSKGIKLLSFSARGFTSFLGQNQPKPGIISDVDLAMLIRSNISCSEISCESGTPVEHYIYVKAAGTLWDAVVAYSLKSVGRYPYIYGNNKVMITRGESSEIEYGREKITAYGDSVSTGNIVSQVFMKGTADSYDYLDNNAVADGYKICRRKYYDLDKQWLYDVNKGLRAKVNYSDRAVNGDWFEYYGFCNEQLYDSVKNSGTDCDGKFVNRVRVAGDKTGVHTKVWCYNDRYGQMN